MTTRTLLTGIAAIAPTAVLLAGSVEPVADTFILAENIAGDVATDDGKKPVLAIKSDRPAGRLDRIGVIRFETPGGAEFENAAITLHLKVQGPSATSGTYELYGVLPGALEDDLDESTYTAAQPDAAVDASSNRLKESLVHDPDSEQIGVQPVATVTLEDGQKTIVFEGEALVQFLRDVADDDVAFILKATMPAERAGTPATFFHSREADDGLRPTLAWD
ncbi:MAG: hypothetical protein AAGD32_05005 [Planctomycetota bacterium]